MVDYGGLWLLMVAYGCLWLLMVAYDCLWWLIVASGCLWLLMVAVVLDSKMNSSKPEANSPQEASTTNVFVWLRFYS